MGCWGMLLLIIALYWKLDCKSASLIYSTTAYADATSLCFHKGFDNCEAQARSIMIGTQPILGTIEAVENVRQLFC